MPGQGDDRGPGWGKHPGPLAGSPVRRARLRARGVFTVLDSDSEEGRPVSGSTGAVNGPLCKGVPESDSGAGAFQRRPLVTSLELGSLPIAGGCARLHTRHVLLEWELQELVEDAESW